MFGKYIKVGPRVYGGFDADAQAFITAAGITDATQQQAINTLVVDYKTAGIWNKRKAIYPMVGGTATTHKYNLKDPRDLDAAFRLKFYGGLTHSSTGIQPNGANGYADTSFKPSINAFATSGGLGYYSRTNISELKIDIGSYGGGGENDIYINYTGYGTFYLWNSTGSGTAIPNTDSRGWYSLNRTNTNQQGWKNGIKVLDESKTGGVSTYNTYLFAANAVGTALYFGSKECAFAILSSDTLTDAEILNEYNIIQTFQTTLGRSIGTQTVSDADAQAFINAANIQDQVQATAINNLCIDLKGYNIWTKMKAIYPFVGGTATTHKYNLKDPRDLDAAFRLVFNGTVTHSANGVQGNGTNAYMNTNFIPSSDYTSNTNFGLFLYTSSTSAGSTDRDMAIFTTSGTPSLNLTSKAGTSSQTDLFDFANRISVTGYNVEGFYIGSRTASNSAKLYRNGTSIGTTTAAAGTAPSIFLTLGGANLSNSNPITAVGAYSAKTFSFAGTCDGLTDTEASNFYTAVQAFQTTLSRNI